MTFCRALGIPARYVSGYMPTSGSRALPPMDFHAWFEVWLGERWWTLDGRYNMPRIGRLATGRGRDAADVAMITTYGDARLTQMACGQTSRPRRCCPMVDDARKPASWAT